MKKSKLSTILAISVAAMITITSSFTAFADEPTHKKGDVNGDTEITMQDVVDIQKHIAQLTKLEGDAVWAADTTNNNAIEMTDVTTLQKYIAKLISEFPTEAPSDTDSGSNSDLDSDSDSDLIIDPDLDSDSDSDTEDDIIIFDDSDIIDIGGNEEDSDEEGWSDSVYKP